MYPNSKIIVIDNNSIDKTADIASKLGAEVIFEKSKVKPMPCARVSTIPILNS